MAPNAWNACLTSGDDHFSLPLNQSSYFCGPDCRSRRSSSQSVPGQPEAAPLSRPMHHGAVPEDLILAARAVSSSYVLGMVQWLAEKILGSYQIRLLRAALMKMPYCLPLTWTSFCQLSPYWLVIADWSTMLSRAISLAALAKVIIWPGPGRPARSGGLPAVTRVVRTALRSRVPSYWILIPVLSSKGFTMARKDACSEPPQVARIFTVPPLVLLPVVPPQAATRTAENANTASVRTDLRFLISLLNNAPSSNIRPSAAIVDLRRRTVKPARAVRGLSLLGGY